jgi:hypothetical protein
MWQADRTPMSQRPWFRISEIVDICSRIPGSIAVDQGKHERSIELLRKSILAGEFDDPKGRSKIANLHSHRDAVLLRFARNSAAEPEFFRQWISYLWIRRADCEAWFKRNGVKFPEDWAVAQNSGHTKQKSGRKPQFAARIQRVVFELMDYHGDLSDDDPEWSIQAHVEKAVRAALGDDAPRAESTIRSYVSNSIAVWRKSKADN